VSCLRSSTAGLSPIFTRGPGPSTGIAFEDISKDRDSAVSRFCLPRRDFPTKGPVRRPLPPRPPAAAILGRATTLGLNPLEEDSELFALIFFPSLFSLFSPPVLSLPPPSPLPGGRAAEIRVKPKVKSQRCFLSLAHARRSNGVYRPFPPGCLCCLGMRQQRTNEPCGMQVRQFKFRAYREGIDLT